MQYFHRAFRTPKALSMQLLKEECKRLKISYNLEELRHGTLIDDILSLNMVLRFLVDLDNLYLPENICLEAIKQC